jgi:hypothetical protein
MVDSAWRAGCTNGLGERLRLIVAALVRVGDGGDDGEDPRITLGRVGVGEAGLEMVFAVRCFGVRRAGDKISTTTRGI